MSAFQTLSWQINSRVDLTQNGKHCRTNEHQFRVASTQNYSKSQFAKMQRWFPQKGVV